MLYCSHKDGSVSVWQRTARLLTYSLVGSAKLLPPPLKMHTGLAPALVALAAGLWRGLQPQGDEPSAAGPLVTLHLRDGGGRRHPGTVRRKVLVPSEAALPDDQDSSVHGVAPSSPTAAIASGTALASHIGEQAYSVLLMGVGSDGKVWQWQLPLLAGARTEPRAPLPTMPMLQVLGLLHMLSGRVTALSVCSAPVVLPGGNEVVAALAAGTSVGTIEVVPVQQGNLMPLDASISSKQEMPASSAWECRGSSSSESTHRPPFDPPPSPQSRCQCTRARSAACAGWVWGPASCHTAARR